MVILNLLSIDELTHCRHFQLKRMLAPKVSLSPNEFGWLANIR